MRCPNDADSLFPSALLLLLESPDRPLRKRPPVRGADDQSWRSRRAKRLPALWPTGKIPLLQEGERIVPETSIIIEHIDSHQASAARLLPEHPDIRLLARLWDRLFDCYVMTPMQRFIAQQLRPVGQRDPLAEAEARAGLASGYDLIEKRLGDGPWAAGADFGIADCAAAPALFYGRIIEPFPETHTRLSAYFERLMARPSVRRAIAEARPWFHYFPLADAIPARFLSDAGNAA